MDIDTAKILVGTVLMAVVATFSVMTVSSTVIDMLRDLHILPSGPDGDRSAPPR